MLQQSQAMYAIGGGAVLLLLARGIGGGGLRARFTISDVQDRDPVRGVTVTVLGVATATTNAYGICTIGLPEEGEYEFTADCEGYERISGIFPTQ